MQIFAECFGFWGHFLSFWSKTDPPFLFDIWILHGNPVRMSSHLPGLNAFYAKIWPPEKSKNQHFFMFFTCINMSVWPECLLKSLQIGQKHVCRPSNDVDRLYFGWFSLWNSNSRSKSPSQSSGNVEKTAKFKKINFFAYFPGINMSLFSGRAFGKPQERSETGLLGIKCCQSLVILPVFNW